MSKTFKTKAAAAKALSITETQLDLIGQAAYAVWEECAYDVFATYAECGERTPSSISRAAAIEVALDADRTTEMLKRKRAYFNSDFSRDKPDDIRAAIAALSSINNYGALERAMSLYFTHTRYGL